ncbi:hypothetical protein DS742_23970 [Lacrimispora amygdalina]|uniref:CO dehydrogenase flavoprotein C-terminal domain-containing protein n=1 Tax=Lacrimispora amygdalina TaxID=253257 RepID=A0A3E2N5V6_9FIRM|nr:hypothetical protein DS742_23970 [Clostridium indicum]
MRIALNVKIKTTAGVIEAEKFFTGERKTTALNHDEIVTEIQMPSPNSGTKQNFIKFAQRPTIDFPVVNVATSITIEGDKVSDVRIVLNAVAPVPKRAIGVEEALKGKIISESVVETAVAAIANCAVPLKDNKYKVQIAKTLIKRAILE